MISECLQPDITHAGVALGVLLIESWLGKTSKVSAGSILELALHAGIKLANLITKKG